MENDSEKPLVVLIHNEFGYPNNFLPNEIYPEFETAGIHKEINPKNEIFRSVRELFLHLKFDEKNIGSSVWNPLSEIIEPGNTVLIKPNFVLHRSKCKKTTRDVLITHPTVITAVIDYVILALKGRGTIIIGDSPIQEAVFEDIITYHQMGDYLNSYKKNTKINIEIIDFRKERSINKIYREIQRIELAGDPRGYSRIELSEKSALIDITDQYNQFRVTNYDKEKMLSYHNLKSHSYLIANSVLKSDVIISLPKLKSHRKAGITCALKNLIGINGSKDCLPHHRKGSREENGDEYLHKSFRKRLLSNIEEKRAQSTSRFFCFILFLSKLVVYTFERIFPYKESYKEGNWYGNETIPKTIIDINYILNFVNKNGKLTDMHQKRKLLTITDAIICGEGEGPLCSNKKEVGYLLASQDFLANDIVASLLAGFDPLKIPTILSAMKSPININNIDSNFDIRITSNNRNFQDINTIKTANIIKFEPTSGWKNHIEL
ncbi:MAG: DUF362 domain-containing protein [Candidatus Thorarchaeota archaeon]